MNLLPSVVAIVVADLMSSQRKTYRRVLTGVRKRSASTVWSPSAREQSFYALIKQFGFARGRRSHYPLCHDSEFVLPAPKLKLD